MNFTKLNALYSSVHISVASFREVYLKLLESLEKDTFWDHEKVKSELYKYIL